jgi:Uma2 family endonuclease
MALTGRRLTLDEFLALPEAEPALEYADGEITQKVSPKIHHGRLQYRFAQAVNLYGEPRQLAMAFTETRSTFGGRSYVPDVGIYRWAKLPLLPDGLLADDTTIPWDVVVEIVSPDQSRAEIERKCQWYLANGVEIALMIDPIRRDIVRYDADGGRVELRGDDCIDLDAVLPGFTLTAAALFASLYPGGI